MKRLTILACAFMLLTACGAGPRSRTAAILENVETYINERPDSALGVLLELDTNRFRAQRTRVHYYLLLGIAADKNNLDNGSGLSEMEQAEAWYSVHGNPHDRMRTYYYLADKQNDAGMIAEAAVNFSRALDLANGQQDWFYAGMAARNLSNLFLAGYDYTDAFDFAQQAVEAFERIDKPHHLLYSKMLLAIGHYNMQRFSQSISLCDSVIVWAMDLGYPGIAADALSTSAEAYISLDPPVQDSTLARLNRLEERFPLNSTQTAIYAWALYLKGDPTKAEVMIARAYAAAKSETDSIRVMPWEERIAEAMNNPVRANILLTSMQHFTDKQLNNAILQSVEAARTHYFKEQNDRLTYKIQKERQRVTEVISLIILLSVIVFSLFRARAMRAEQQVREQGARLEEQEKANKVLSDKLYLYGTTVRETLDFGFDVLNRLSDAYYHPNMSKQDNYHEIIKGYLLDVTSRNRLGDSIETNINIIHDDVLSKLRAEVPTLKEEDIKLFSFCLFGFSYKAINAFSPNSSSINTVYSRVFRLRKAIGKSGSEYAEFFLSFLGNGVSKNGHAVQET